MKAFQIVEKLCTDCGYISFTGVYYSYTSLWVAATRTSLIQEGIFKSIHSLTDSPTTYDVDHAAIATLKTLEDLYGEWSVLIVVFPLNILQRTSNPLCSAIGKQT
jgi:hypothetical protein